MMSIQRTLKPVTFSNAICRHSAVLPRRAVRISASLNKEKSSVNAENATALAVAGLIAPMLLDNGAALAIGREYGILEGQIASLTHPALMFFLFGASCYAGYLGFQWRHTRELATQIKELKAQRKPSSVGPDGQTVEAPPSPLDGEIAALEKVCSCQCFFPLSKYAFNTNLINTSLMFLLNKNQLHATGTQGAYWTEVERET